MAAGCPHPASRQPLPFIYKEQEINFEYGQKFIFV